MGAALISSAISNILLISVLYLTSKIHALMEYPYRTLFLFVKERGDEKYTRVILIYTDKTKPSFALSQTLSRTLTDPVEKLKTALLWLERRYAAVFSRSRCKVDTGQQSHLRGKLLVFHCHYLQAQLQWNPPRRHYQRGNQQERCTRHRCRWRRLLERFPLPASSTPVGVRCGRSW